MVVPLDNVLSARQKEAFKEEERFGSQSDKVHTYGQKEFYYQFSKLRSQNFCLLRCQIYSMNSTLVFMLGVVLLEIELHTRI